MLVQLRKSIQRLTTPSFIKNLSNFHLNQARNVQYADCRTGEIAWLDFPRSDININGKNTNFYDIINQHNKPKKLNGYQYRKTLQKILSSKLKEISNQDVNKPLIDECITILNQASLYGSSQKILISLGEDIQNRTQQCNGIIPIMQMYRTNIEVISSSILKIRYKEQLNLRDVCTGKCISHINTSIDFNISTSEENVITYSDPKISIEMPRSIATSILPINTIRLTNILIPCYNAINRIRAFITGSPFQKATPHQITHTHGLCIIQHKLPEYKCLPVTMLETADKKEETKKHKFYTRSTFTPPITQQSNIHQTTDNPTKNSTHITSATVHSPKVQTTHSP